MHLVNGFKNLDQHNARSRSSELPLGSFEPTDSNNRASGPKDESTYLDRIARSRRLYFVIAVGWAFVYVGVELLKGLFS